MRYCFSLVLGILLLASTPAAYSQALITTVAGADRTVPFVPIPAMTVSLGQLNAVAADDAGSFYLADGLFHVVLRVSTDGTLRIFAGNGIQGYSGDGGPATSASLNAPGGVAVDGAGNVFIADTGNHRIRRVATDGTISTYAGNGSAGFSGDTGPAGAAALRAPTALAFDAGGSLYLADTGNNRVRRVTPAGIISTVAGNGDAGFSGDGGNSTSAALNAPEGVAVDATGNVYIADTGNHCVRRVASGTIRIYAGDRQPRFAGDGAAATSASLLSPKGLLFRGGELLIADSLNRRVRRVAADGRIFTFAGNGQAGSGGDNGPAESAMLSQPVSLAMAGGTNVLIADTGIKRVRRVTAANVIGTVAGTLLDRDARDGGPATGAELDYPNGVAFDAAGNLYFTEGNRVRRVTPAGVISTFAGNGTSGYSGDGGQAAGASLSFPFAIAFDRAGNLLIADTYNQRVRRVDSAGIITTIAGTGVADFSGDGGPAAQARLSYPTGVAVDGQGNIYVSDLLNNRVRRIASNGVIDTYAGCGFPCPLDDNGNAKQVQLRAPYLLAVDAAGNLFIADSQSNRVRRVAPNGNLTTVAGTGARGFSGDGGPATSALLTDPRGLALDAAGNLYITDMGNDRVRVVRGTTISTVAGTGTRGFAGDGGAALTASLYWPSGVALDGSGNVVFADSGNHRMRAVLNAATSFNVLPGNVSLAASAQGAAPPEATVSITGAVAGLRFTAAASADWVKLSRADGSLPGALQVTADPAGLGPGSYSATVAVTANGANPPTRFVNVALTVAAAQAPVLAASTGRLTFQFVSGGAPSATSLSVANAGGGEMDYHTEATEGWLTATPPDGSLTPGAPANLTVTANPAGLAPGTYQAKLRLRSDSTGQSIEVPVAMTVAAVEQKILVSQTGLTFTAVAGGGAPLPQSIGVLNLGRGRMPWNLRVSTLAGGDWLRVSRDSGEAGGAGLDVAMVDISVDAKGLRPAEYSGQIQVRSAGADNSPQFVSVILNVLAEGSNPGPEVRPTGLIFTGLTGSRPGSQDVLISNLGGRSVAYNSGRVTEDGRDWFVHAPVSSTLVPDRAGRVAVQAQFEKLEAGVQRGVLTLLFNDGNVRTVNLLTVVADAAADGKEGSLAGGCEPKDLKPQITTLRDGFSLIALQPVALQAKVVDSCGAPFTRGQVFASFTNGDRDVDLVHIGDGVWSGTWQPRNTSQAGVQLAVTATVAISGSKIVAGQQRLSGSLRTGSGVPFVSADSVQSAASLSGKAPVAPGSLITLKGEGLADGEGRTIEAPYATELLNTQVLLGGEPLPLLFASSGQINAQVPYNINVNTQLQVLVRRGTALSVPELITVAAAQPAIFTRDESGQGQGWIKLDRDDRPFAEPASPARAGDLIRIWCAGLGAVTPPVPAGQPAPDSPRAAVSLPVAVTIDGTPAEVLRATLEPGVAGRYLVEAVVPAGVAGDALPVLVTVDGQTSPAVTMAVR